MSSRTDVLPKPDPDEPDSIFCDGEHMYEVQVLPALFPIRGSQGTQAPWDLGTAIVAALYFLLGGMVARAFDSRWKVLVARRRLHGLGTWRAISMEVVATQQMAENRRIELLRAWQAGRFSQVPALSKEDMRALRRRAGS